jgi:hypothetical protein
MGYQKEFDIEPSGLPVLQSLSALTKRPPGTCKLPPPCAKTPLGEISVRDDLNRCLKLASKIENRLINGSQDANGRYQTVFSAKSDR